MGLPNKMPAPCAGVFLGGPRGIEVTESLAGRPRQRQSGGLPEAIRAAPAIRAAGASPRRRSRRGDAEGFPAVQPAMPPKGDRSH